MITLYNSRSHKLEIFTPLDVSHVKMYVCGPTVYDRPHIGNARPAVVFDVLYRLLKYEYQPSVRHEPCPRVTYVRNITDIDDKIYKAASAKGIDIQTLTHETTKMYHIDISALNVLPVDIEPHATDHINDIIKFIRQIIINGYGYISNGHVYFDTNKYCNYGILSNIKERIEGARVDISDNKHTSTDFVLWKPISPEFPIGWDSPWGKGRPGWHIECSAMAGKYLGEQFDIHGGGHDLIFPHHENEIAQSYAINNKIMANYWLHNGHVMINGTKMSKSLGNFYTVRELLAEFPGEVIRLALLMTNYRSPINFTKSILIESKNLLNRWYTAIRTGFSYDETIDEKVLNALKSDLNTPMAIMRISEMATKINQGQKELIPTLVNTARTLLGLLLTEPEQWFKCDTKLNIEYIEKEIERRTLAKKNKDYATADSIRNNLKEQGILLEDTVIGTQWKRL